MPPRPFKSVDRGPSWTLARWALATGAGRRTLGPKLDLVRRHNEGKRSITIGARRRPSSRCPAEARDARWVEPVHIAEIEFTAWTRDGHIRHPSFKGMREERSQPSATTADGDRGDKGIHPATS